MSGNKGWRDEDSSDDDGPPGMSNMLNREQKLAADGNVDDTDVDDAHPRRCTDVVCLVIFAVYMALMVHIFLVAVDKGDVNKLTHGIDWQGNICGVSEATKNQPLLYWCSTGVTISDGICVSECPTTTDGFHKCPSDAKAPTVQKIPIGDSQKKDGDYEIKMTITRNMTDHRDVLTSVFLNMYCLPTENVEMVEQIMNRGQFKGVTDQLVMGLRGVYESRWFLLGVAIGTVILSFSFIMLLSVFVDIVVWGIIGACFLLLAAATGYFLYGAVNKEHNLFAVYFDEHAKLFSLITGCITGILLVVYSAVICCSLDSISTSSRCIRKACRTIQNLPTLLFEPAVNLFWKVVFWCALIYGMNMIASMGDIVPTESPFEVAHTAGVSMSGVGRKVQLENWMWRNLFLWILGSVWLTELVDSAGSYAISHAVVMFTLNKDESCRSMPLIVGYCNAFIYHLGTLAFASFIIGVLKILTAIAAFIAKQAHNPDGTPNVAVKAACCCCTLCLSCLQKIMRMMNETAFVDTAIRGTSYPRAAKNVFKMFLKYPGDIAISHSMAVAVRNIGTVVIGGFGTWVSYWCLTSKWFMSSVDTVLSGSSALLYTSSVAGSTAASAIVCFGVAASFMMSFNQVANTLIYCLIWRKECGLDTADLEDDDDDQGRYQEM